MAAPKAKAGSAARKPRRKEKKNITVGQAHIKSTFNNTIVSITDSTGAVISWSSSGDVGYKGSRKSTPFAAFACSSRSRSWFDQRRYPTGSQRMPSAKASSHLTLCTALQLHPVSNSTE